MLIEAMRQWQFPCIPHPAFHISFLSLFLFPSSFSTFGYVNCEKRALKRWKILNHFARRTKNFYFHMFYSTGECGRKLRKNVGLVHFENGKAIKEMA